MTVNRQQSLDEWFANQQTVVDANPQYAAYTEADRRQITMAILRAELVQAYFEWTEHRRTAGILNQGGGHR